MAKKDLKAFLKDNKFIVSSEHVSDYKIKLQDYLKNVNIAIQKNETEEHLKGILVKFLKDNFYYENKYTINTSSSVDAAISKDNILQVLIETKKPSNTVEMVSEKNLNKKALWEIILYYIEATRSIQDGKVKRNPDSEIKNLIITDCKRFFLFDSQKVEFIVKGELENFWEKKETAQLISKNKDIFYDKAKEYFSIKDNISKLNYIYFDIEELYKTRAGITMSYKVLSKQILLKDNAKKVVAAPLNAAFYQELLYILGLKEVKENGKTLIKINFNVENTFAVQVYKYLKDDKGILDENEVIDKTFSAIIVWTNRLLFIKLFEGQLFSINGEKQEYHILDKDKIQNENDLQNLFFKILGKKDRDSGGFFDKFKDIPYLNSSLFENYDVEKNDVMIRDIDNKDVQVKPHSKTKKQGKLKLVEYVIDFLNSYNFSSVSVGENETASGKEIIDAAVLGLIFEKINGYKDGSHYTPSSITEYICKETIERSVLQKVNNFYNQSLKTFDDLILFASDITKKKQINDIINSLKICDPAVGSGHFLVSALNRIIAIKSELGVLFYHNENRLLTDYEIRIINDILTITDGNGELFSYNRANAGSFKVQKTIFCEKRFIIENCLFGVDINDKAVSICQLRLWIELLKNAYYENNVMETLPNIDINIKCGNSLLNKLPVEAGKKLSGKTDKELKKLIIEYKQSVNIYKHESNKLNKQNLKITIEKVKRILHQSAVQMSMDFMGDTTDYAEMDLMNNAFEWAIEFPEILDDNGAFLGFDCVIGNPPYIDSEEMVRTMKAQRELYNSIYKVAKGNWDLFLLFIELAIKLLKKGGCNSFILPNKLLAANYAKETRKLMSNYGLIGIRDYSDVKVFESAAVYPVIYILEKAKLTVPCVMQKMLSFDIMNIVSYINQEEILKQDNWAQFFVEDTLATKLIAKMNASPKLETIATVKGAATVNEAYEIKNILTEDEFKFEEHFKLVNTGTIDRYCSLWESAKTQYIKTGYYKPVLSKLELKNLYKQRYVESLKDKIIIGGMCKVLECYLDNGQCLAGKSTTIVFDSKIDLNVLVGILNSKLMTFFYSTYFKSLSLAGGFFRFGTPQIKLLPIAENKENIYASLTEMVVKIISNYDLELDKQINCAVYKLYNLTDEEIAIVEESVK